MQGDANAVAACGSNGAAHLPPVDGVRVVPHLLQLLPARSPIREPYDSDHLTHPFLKCWVDRRGSVEVNKCMGVLMGHDMAEPRRAEPCQNLNIRLERRVPADPTYLLATPSLFLSWQTSVDRR